MVIYSYQFSDLSKKQIFFEKNKELDVYVWASRSKKYIFMQSWGREETEMRYTLSTDTKSPFKLFRKIEKKILLLLHQ